MRHPLLLDTGGWLCALQGEPEYAKALEDAHPAVVPVLVLAELDWHLRTRRSAMRRVSKEIAQGAYVLETLTTSDLERAAQIDAKFPELDLGLVDASIGALAERLGIYRVLTIDSDFSVMRLGKYWRRPLELAVPLPRGA